MIRPTCAFTVALFLSFLPAIHAADARFHEIQVVDSVTGRGVPAVELRTTNQISSFTDSAGRVAFFEPGMMGSDVFFSLTSLGYEYPKDFFGYAGTKVKAIPGGKTVLQIKRTNIAERLYRITGGGIYRDTLLLGLPAPITQPVLNAKVTGQDSVQREIYRGKIYWFYGDTSWAEYPLGNFRTTGATSELPANGGLNPSAGINLKYFKTADGFTKEMCPFTPSDGVIWIDGLLVMKDAAGQERLICHYTRLLGLGSPVEQGLARWNDAKEQFDPWISLPMSNTWRFPQGHSLKNTEASGEYFYFSNPVALTRVKTNAVDNPGAYEAWSCLADGSSADPATAQILRDGAGKPAYRWTKNAPPVGPDQQKAFQSAGLITGADLTFFPRDTITGKVVSLHGGATYWNAWRQRWVVISTQEYGDKSLLGEIYYTESRNLTGPFAKACKIITHDRYDFYNPTQHPFFDQDGGRTIYIEGTYTNTFSGSPTYTPRYDYNQMMYRLDLSDARLQTAWAP